MLDRPVHVGSICLDREDTPSLGGDSWEASATPPVHGDLAELALAPGACLGRYTIRARMGSGGMGEVFAAHDPELDRVVALKVIRPDLAGESAEALARFQREAQAMARLNHPNVVSVFDVGTASGRVFVAMERVEGPTLAVWLAERPRGWRAVVDVFVQAGRGLAAAHAAGIVHRDFKPSNVIVGDRVRVADFGLARAVNDPEPRPPARATSVQLEVAVTRTGAAPGTPAYMAPEQRTGAPARVRSDLYAFGVALHEALYGARPGQRRAPRTGPRWLSSLVDRALQVRPEDRYPSMVELLTELGRGPGRARRRWLAAAAVALVVAGVTGRRALEASPCGGDDALIASVWDDGARAEVAAAFRATGRAHADETFARVDASLRARQRAWAAAHRDACEATHVRHEQSEALLDLRMRCLGRARTEIAALVSALAHVDSDGEGLDRAAPAAARTGDLERCVDPAIPPAAPPRDPAVAAAVATMQQDLARLSALRKLGQWKEGLVLGRELVVRARALGDDGTLADVFLAGGAIEVQAGGDREAAIALFFEAARAGAAGHDDTVVAWAFTYLTGALVRAKRLDAAEIAFDAARAAVTRAGNPIAPLADLFQFRADLLLEKGDHAGGLVLRWVALGLVERAYGAESFESAAALGGVAQAMTLIGHPCAALSFHDRGIVVAEKAVGPGRRLGTLHLNAGAARLACGDIERGAVELERALAMQESAFGPDTPKVAFAAHALALARVQQRRLPEARALAERALRLRVAAFGAGSAEAARSTSRLATVARHEGRAGEAHRLFVDAIARQRASLGERHAELGESYRGDALALLDLGRTGEARAAIERAAAIDLALFGVDSSRYADTLIVLGHVSCAEGRCDAAAPLYQRAAAWYAREAGPTSAMLVEPLAGACAALLVAGDVVGARAAGERAATLASPPADLAARAQLCLARAMWEQPPERQAAVAVARAARAELARHEVAARELAEVDRWLAER